MLTQFHGENVERRIKNMQIEQEIKDTMLQQVAQFRSDLFEMADYDPMSNRNGEGLQPSFNYF